MLVRTLTSPGVVYIEEGGYALRFEAESSGGGVRAGFAATSTFSELSSRAVRLLSQRQHDSREVLGCMGVIEVEQGESVGLAPGRIAER